MVKSKSVFIRFYKIRETDLRCPVLIYVHIWIFCLRNFKDASPLVPFWYYRHIISINSFQAKEVAKTCGSRIVVIHENSLLVDTYEGGADLPGQPPGRTIRKRPPFELPEQVREKIRTQNPDEDLTSKNQSLTVTSASPPMSPISYSPPSEPGPSNHVTIFSTKYLTPSKPPTSAVNSGNDYSPSKRPIPSSLPFTQADAIIANSKICQLCKLSSSPRHIRNAKDNWMGCEFAACQYWIHLSCSGFVFSKNQHLDATKFYCGEHYPKSGSRKRN